MESPGRSMKPGWKIGLLICMAGYIGEPIGRHHRAECTSRKRMDGSVHWESRHWRTKSSSRPWSLSSTRFTRRTFSVSRMVKDSDHDLLDDFDLQCRDSQWTLP